MKIKKLLFMGVIASCALLSYGQTSVIVEGDVEIKDDPATADAKEGNLRIRGGLTLNDSDTPTAFATGKNSIAVGNGAYAIGDYSYAKGSSTYYRTYAYSRYGIAIGDNAKAGNPDEETEDAIAFGTDSIALKSRTLAIGKGAEANQVDSIAIGRGAKANGYMSIAMGFLSSTTGSMPMAIGPYSTASGDGAVAFGFMNKANIHESMALGFKTTTSARASSTLGANVTANAYRQTVVGSWNDTDEFGSSPNLWNAEHPIFVVGNGETEEKKSNALVVLKSGDTVVNGDFTANKVVVKSPSGGISMGEFGE